MGLQEFLKRAWAQITHRDPEGTDDGFYKFHSDQTTYPADGDVVHEYTASSGVQSPPGVEYYKDANNDMAWKWTRNTNGMMPVALYSSTGTDHSTFIEQLRNAANATPYSSNGSTASSTSAKPAMLAKSISITAQADGSVTSAELLASAGAGDKWTIYRINLGCGDLAVAGQGKQLTLSDGIGYVSAGAPVNGPIIQATAATAINYSAVAGMFGNAEVMTLNIQYRESA